MGSPSKTASRSYPWQGKSQLCVLNIFQSHLVFPFSSVKISFCLALLSASKTTKRHNYQALWRIGIHCVASTQGHLRVVLGICEDQGLSKTLLLRSLKRVCLCFWVRSHRLLKQCHQVNATCRRELSGGQKT